MTTRDGTTRDKLRIAGVGYLNAAPLTFGLDADESLELFLGPPSEVTRRLAEGEADVALLPVASAATLGALELLDLGIVARSAVRSVVVVSQVPVDDIETLSVDASSRTSVVLARLLLPKHTHVVSCPPGEAIAAATGKTGSLVIGDPAIDLAERFPHHLDLAEAWRARTGLPFVFAAWAARRGTFTTQVIERLHRAAREGMAARDAIADAYASRRRSGAPQSRGESDAARFRSYLRDAISYEIDTDARRGLDLFFEQAATATLLPPMVRPGALPSVDALLDRAIEGGRLSHADAYRLHEDADLFSLGMAADAVRRRKASQELVTYIVDRNVNYTNVCTTSCRFCAFYRPVGHPEGYVLSREVLGQKLQEVVDAGGVQILLQGGLNPELRIEWYEDLFRWMKKEYRLGLHALSPEEILHIARMESLTVRQVLDRLHAAGLDSVPGGGAEILVDRVRRKIAKTKCTSEEWLGVMRVAHQMGLRSSATMMYGTVDTTADRIQHLVKIRDLQDETGGFTAFFCWDYQFEQGTHLEPGENGTHLYLRTQAVARLMLDNVAHVGASWVTQGPAVGQVALRFGADDFGSVMFEENVVSSAGTTFGINADKIEGRIHEAGFRAVRRNVRYEWLNEPG